jgi:hypothetical protein
MPTTRLRLVAFMTPNRAGDRKHRGIFFLGVWAPRRFPRFAGGLKPIDF